MTKKTKTINLQGKEYAQVAQRIQEFRSANPRGFIETTPMMQEGGAVMFRARVVKDKGDEASAEATGHSLGENKGVKAFEKLETIAVGRALALLGYGSDGEIASSEEMDEFFKFQADKRTKVVEESAAKLSKAKNLEELKTIWASLPIEAKTELGIEKDKLKEVLSVKAETVIENVKPLVEKVPKTQKLA